MTGPEHEPNFATEVVVQGQVVGIGEGTTKKSAEKRAAEAAILYLNETDNLSNIPNEPTSDETFNGPYPIFQRVLAEALHVANARVDSKLKGEVALEQVRDLARNSERTTSFRDLSSSKKWFCKFFSVSSVFSVVNTLPQNAR
jgi:Double-stranded RNA binding motif